MHQYVVEQLEHRLRGRVSSASESVVGVRYGGAAVRVTDQAQVGLYGRANESVVGRQHVVKHGEAVRVVAPLVSLLEPRADHLVKLGGLDHEVLGGHRTSLAARSMRSSVAHTRSHSH